MASLMKYIAYGAAGLFIVFGFVILFTNYAGKLPGQFRTMMGIVFVLYGIYRISVTIYKSKNNGGGDEN